MAEKPLGELVPFGGGDPIPLLRPKMLVGRRPSCDVALDFPNVSSHHCEFLFENGYWRVRDLGSRNGVKVNGERVESKWLQPGDEVSIAKHRYEIRYTSTGTAPPPDEAEENPFGRSLLEKAGLARPERTTEPPAGRRPGTTANPGPPGRFNKDEDDAVRYLLDD